MYLDNVEMKPKIVIFSLLKTVPSYNQQQIETVFSLSFFFLVNFERFTGLFFFLNRDILDNII